MAEHDAPRSYRFPRSHRLHGRRAFAHVFDAKMRKNAGVLSVYSRPNDLPYSRLGLSISRRVGNAVKRNLIKRRLREAFRLCQHDWPQGYDLVVVVRPHRSATLADYQRMLFGAIRSSHLGWEKRRERREAGQAKREGDEG